MTTERMSLVDTAWLRMDSPVNLMMIVGIWLFEPGLPHAALRERLRDKLLPYARFRQKVVHEALGAAWVEDDDFDLDRHLVRERLVRQRGRSQREALQARASELAVTPLDPDHPLWQFHLVERYEGGSALILRIHHCIADGIALVALLMSIADGGAGLPAHAVPHAPAHADDEGDWLADAVVRPLAGAVVEAIDVGGEAVAASLRALAAPQRLLAQAARLARSGTRIVRDAAALALLSDDSKTRLKGPLAGTKVVAWCEPVPLDVVKAVSKALGCSLNDVLLACVANAIGDYLRDEGEDPAGKEIRAMVPVNLRPPEQAWQLGNRFGLAPVTLPIGIANPVECVYAVRQRMGELKNSYQPLLAYALLGVSGAITKPLQDALSDLFLKKTTAVMTNVPGPAQPIRLCGSTLRQSIVWVPSSGNVGFGVSIVSYAGGVQFGLITDSARCPDPQRIIDRFAPQFERLLLLALMLPWAPERPAAPVRRAR